jgi:hypothetical protein
MGFDGGLALPLLNKKPPPVGGFFMSARYSKNCPQEKSPTHSIGLLQRTKSENQAASCTERSLIE